MSYEHESDQQQARPEGGVEETEAYQPTAEWDAASEQAPWAQGVADGTWDEQADGAWDEHADDAWHDGADDDEWQHYDDGDEQAAGGVAGAKQSLSVAADKITRWFAGLDRRPEYEDQYGSADPVAEVAPESTAGVGGGRRAAAERAIAANRRRSIAASRSNPKRGSAHVERGARGDRDRNVVAAPPVPAPAAPVPAPVAHEPADEPLPELMGGEGSSRFTVAPLGYNRQAVDEHVAELERELAELRESGPRTQPVEPPMSVQEELERIGEQTASILVVAHDKAHETTRLAQQQAERCVADAAANAVSITDEAKRKLRELEAETETVRRRRERLIADARNVAASLVVLADEADKRFAAEQPAAEQHDGEQSGTDQPDPGQPRFGRYGPERAPVATAPFTAPPPGH